ncbi:MAG: PCMD domain-containing protein [Chitinophagales bacterium]|nr:PCMD domain-containing protein [Chitinophagales bacterium]
MEKYMVKKITTLLLSSFAFIAVNAQTTITNGNMELWDNPGNSSAEPSNWNSGKTAGGFWGGSVPQTCWRDTSSLKGGSFCAKLVSGEVMGNVANGALTTGRLMAKTTTKAEGYIETVTSDPNFRMDFVGKPDSFVFWYRFSPKGSDYPRVEARLHINTCQAPEIPVGGNHSLDTNNIVARALWTGTNTTVSGWTRVSVPFVYRNSTTPQYILITSTSSGDPTGGTKNSTVWLDEYEVIYKPILALSGNKNYGTFYVSANSGATINVPFTATGTLYSTNTFTAQLSNATGSFATPTTLGTLAGATAGTINGTIAAGTAAGSGYKVRVVSNNLAAISDTGTATVVLVSTSVAPSAAQTIAVNTNGTSLTVTETAGSSSREWKFATTSGGSYASFSTVQTGTNYTPNFATTGTYYIVCETTYPGGTVVRSNEVQVNVVGNSIAPASPQSLLVNASGTQLTVTESTAATSRVWKYTTTSGSNYQAFAPNQTGTTYTPQFASAGIYYVVCQSTISGVTVTSNEVQISVNSVTLAITNVSGFPIEFSPNAPDKNVTVTFTVSGGTFSSGNVFTAQLSDASGSFANPTNIGNTNSTTGGTINAVVAHTTAGGTQYRVRVIGSNPAVFGNDNGTDLVIDQFSNSVAPTAKQTIAYATNGNILTVTESQNATTRKWKAGNSASGPFFAFTPLQSNATFTPNFGQPGTYFIVCTSFNQYGDSTTTNAVEVEVTNGSTLTTTNVSGSPFYISSKANAGGTATFTSNILFDPSNVFNAELSDASGNFTNPTVIGTLSGTTVSPISITIPNSLATGTGYKVRVTSSSPAVTGTESSAFSIFTFEVTVAPNDTQNAIVNVAANTLTASETHPNATRQWLVSFVSGSFYNAFNPAETGTTINPVFLGAGTAYVICQSVNASNDTAQSAEVVYLITEGTGIKDADKVNMKAWFTESSLNIDWNGKANATLHLYNTAGIEVIEPSVLNIGKNTIGTANLPSGIYLLQVESNGITKQAKLRK